MTQIDVPNTVSLVEEATGAHALAGSAGHPSNQATGQTTSEAHPTANLWACVQAPVNRVEAACALLGLDERALRQLGAAEMLTTPITGSLLDNGHRILDQPGFPHSNLDLAAEVAAGLRVLNAAGTALEAIPSWAYDDERLRHARGAHARTQALAAHSAFHEPSVIDAASRRTSSTFSDAALSLQTLLPLVDARTMRQHELAVAILGHAAAAGIRPALEIRDGIAVCGRIAYRHSGCRGAEGPSGLRVGSLLIDVPDYRGEPRSVAVDRLRSRAGKRTAILVESAMELGEYEAVIRAELLGPALP